MPSAVNHPDLDQRRDLSDLVGAALDGHPDAWAELIDRFQPLITNILRSYRPNPSDLEDMRQEVWTVVVRHLKDLREPRALPGWISTVARHEAAHWCSTARRRGEPTDALLIARVAADADDAARPVDHDLMQTEIRSSIRSGLNELPAGDRTLMLMLFGDDDLSYRDISHALGIPPGRIGPTRARCLRKLRQTGAVTQLVA